MTPREIASAIVKEEKLLASVSTKFHAPIKTEHFSELESIVNFLNTFQIDYEVDFVTETEN